MNNFILSDRVKLWIDQIRTQGVDTLWQRLSDVEREELQAFGMQFENGFKLEEEQRWQEVANHYKFLAEKFPAYSDVAISRASFIISEKINKAIRLYNQGVQAYESKMYTKAVRFFEMALATDKNMEKALYNLAMANKMIYISDPKKFRENKLLAIDKFKKLLELNSSNAIAKAQIDYLSKL